MPKPKNTIDVEFLGKMRPPFTQELPRDWDNVYDEKLGRSKRVDVSFLMVHDGKVIPPNQATENSRCVAFDVPIVIANKYFSQSESYREYKADESFDPQKDIIGYHVPVDDAEILRQDNQRLRNEVRKLERLYLSVKQTLGKEKSVGSGFEELEESPTAEEKKNLAPTKSDVKPQETGQDSPKETAEAGSA